MTLVLMDAKNAVYRYGFAHSTLKNAEGAPTGAVFGVLRALGRLKRKYPDAKFVMVWDGEGASWRHAYYPSYKSSRRAKVTAPPAQPVKEKQSAKARAKARTVPYYEANKATAEEVLRQIPLLKDTLSRMGIPQLEVPCVEADDLIGISAVMQRTFNGECVVFSSDKDFMQLMGIGVQIIRPNTNPKDSLGIESEASVLKRFGCLPSEVLALRAYAGDKSDDIPVAIPGIGEKRALVCLRAGANPAVAEFACRDLKVARKVRGGWAQVRRNYKLMQITGLADPKLFGKGTARHITDALSAASRELVASDTTTRTRAEYMDFVMSLVRLDLLEALDNRHDLWNIQHVKR